MLAGEIINILKEFEKVIPSNAPHRFAIKDGNLELAIFVDGRVYPCILTPDEEIDAKAITKLIKEAIKQDQQRTKGPQNL